MKCHPTSEPLNLRVQKEMGKRAEMCQDAAILFLDGHGRACLSLATFPQSFAQGSSLYLCVPAIIRSQRPSSDTILT